MTTLLALPAVLIGVMGLLHLLATRYGRARGLEGRIKAMSTAHLALITLLLASAAMHLALVPGHLDEDPFRAAMFCLDSLALAAGAALVLADRGWWLLLILTTANLVAYAAYVAGGAESVDLVGLLTKLIELCAAGLALRLALAARAVAGRVPLPAGGA